VSAAPQLSNTSPCSDACLRTQTILTLFSPEHKLLYDSRVKHKKKWGLEVKICLENTTQKISAQKKKIFGAKNAAAQLRYSHFFYHIRNV
jgi:hypothetical protein